MKTVLLVAVLCTSFAAALGQEVRLAPAMEGAAGDWAEAFVPLRLRAEPAQEVEFDGPSLVRSQWGEIALGTARYVFLLGERVDGRADLWVDGNRDRKIGADELVSGVRGPGQVEWEFELVATPAGGAPFPYPLTVLWPEGRGYVYLLGGAPRQGEFVSGEQRAAFVLVDGDLDGVYGTKGDFYAVDVDGDRVIYGDPDGHERFALGEAFTVDGRSYRISQIDPGGASVKLVATGYVPPKPPLLPGFPAPELRFSRFPDGETLNLSDLRGKVVLVDFWATWCGPCMNELPHLLDLYEAHHGDGFEIVAISLDTSERELRTVLSARDVRWPVAFEGKSWDHPLAQLYRVYQIPTSYLLDREGTIRYRDLQGDELTRGVAELLAVPAPAAVREEPPPLVVSGAARPILELDVPSEIGLVPGERTTFSVTLVNISPYEAEEVELTLTGLPPGATAAPVEVRTIPGFGERGVHVVVDIAGSETQVASGSLEVLYHYCIGDSCFQIRDTVALGFAFGAAPVRPAAIPVWWLLVAIGIGLMVAVFLRGRVLTVAALALVGLSVASLAVGLLRGQAVQAWRIGSVLCTACVGIEEVRAEAPALSPEVRAALTEFSGSAHLMVFHTPWCKSCPYAKALVAEVTRVNPRITSELVDADQDRDRAEAAGVIQSGRVIVPAIVVVGTGRVLFGASDLGVRILAALREIE